MKKTEDQSVEGGDDEAVTDTPALDAGNDEFISDAYNLEISDEDLMREMEALRASPTAEDGKLTSVYGYFLLKWIRKPHSSHNEGFWTAIVL